MSVFTKENVSTIPVVSGPSFHDMSDIQIDVNGMAQILSNLDPQKARPEPNMLKILPIILSRISQKFLLLFFFHSCTYPIIP